MSVQVNIELSDEAKLISKNLQQLPKSALLAIKRAMDRENQLTVGHIVREHMTGKGPFPVEEHKLGVVTNRLRGSIRATKAQIVGDQVNSSIGSNVIYAAIHEFGGLIKKKARMQKIRLRTDARGNLVKQFGHSNLAMFASATHKRAKESDVYVGPHEIDMPERAPIRTGIQECAANYTKSISQAMVEAWGNLNK